MTVMSNISAESLPSVEGYRIVTPRLTAQTIVKMSVMAAGMLFVMLVLTVLLLSARS
jgi:hypothetical protein